MEALADMDELVDLEELEELEDLEELFASHYPPPSHDSPRGSPEICLFYGCVPPCVLRTTLRKIN